MDRRAYQRAREFKLRHYPPPGGGWGAGCPWRRPGSAARRLNGEAGRPRLGGGPARRPRGKAAAPDLSLIGGGLVGGPAPLGRSPASALRRHGSTATPGWTTPARRRPGSAARPGGGRPGCRRRGGRSPPCRPLPRARHHQAAPPRAPHAAGRAGRVRASRWPLPRAPRRRRPAPSPRHAWAPARRRGQAISSTTFPSGSRK